MEAGRGVAMVASDTMAPISIARKSEPTSPRLNDSSSGWGAMT